MSEGAEVAAWLHSAEGEEWWRSRRPAPAPVLGSLGPSGQWRATGPLPAGDDPCGYVLVAPGRA